MEFLLFTYYFKNIFRLQLYSQRNAALVCLKVAAVEQPALFVLMGAAQMEKAGRSGSGEVGKILNTQRGLLFEEDIPCADALIRAVFLQAPSWSHRL